MRPKRLSLKLLMSFCIAVVLVTLADTIFGSLLVREGVPRADLLLAANFMSGIVVGILYIRVRLSDIEKQCLTEQRLAKIAEMNHHIRNALQVLSFYARNPDHSRAVDIIDDAIRRIEWTLQEVLPKGWDLRTEEVSLPGKQQVNIRFEADRWSTARHAPEQGGTEIKRRQSGQ